MSFARDVAGLVIPQRNRALLPWAGERLGMRRGERSERRLVHLRGERRLSGRLREALRLAR